MLWNILVTLLIGALAGWLAGQIMKVKGDFWMNAVLGIVGSGVGRFAAGLIGVTASKVSIGGVLIQRRRRLPGDLGGARHHGEEGLRWRS
jgi:uncharacterized membrane protein YeaQ/YmgE (transglycosylase-associated protein family)